VLTYDRQQPHSNVIYEKLGSSTSITNNAEGRAQENILLLQPNLPYLLAKFTRLVQRSNSINAEPFAPEEGLNACIMRLM
jgi:hypothetical protein